MLCCKWKVISLLMSQLTNQLCQMYYVSNTQCKPCDLHSLFCTILQEDVILGTWHHQIAGNGETRTRQKRAVATTDAIIIRVTLQQRIVIMTNIIIKGIVVVVKMEAEDLVGGSNKIKVDNIIYNYFVINKNSSQKVGRLC